METLARPHVTEVVSTGVLLITDALIAHWFVLGHFNVILEVDFVLKTAKAVKALFSFHLIKYKECYFSLMAGLVKFYFMANSRARAILYLTPCAFFIELPGMKFSPTLSSMLRRYSIMQSV